MSATLIILVAIWNLLLVCGLLVGVLRREQVLRWITGLDHESRHRWNLDDDDVWESFLADHPELSRELRGDGASSHVTGSLSRHQG